MPGWIDARPHIVPETYKAALARLGVGGSGENPWPAWSAAEAIDVMTRPGIAAAITSVASPGTDYPFALDARKSIRDTLSSLDVLSPDVQHMVSRDNAVRLCPSLCQGT